MGDGSLFVAPQISKSRDCRSGVGDHIQPGSTVSGARGGIFMPQRSGERIRRGWGAVISVLTSTSANDAAR